MQDATIPQLEDMFASDIIEVKIVPAINKLKFVINIAIEKNAGPTIDALTETSTEKAEAYNKKKLIETK